MSGKTSVFIHYPPIIMLLHWNFGVSDTLAWQKKIRRPLKQLQLSSVGVPKMAIPEIADL